MRYRTGVIQRFARRFEFNLLYAVGGEDRDLVALKSWNSFAALPSGVRGA